MKYKKLFFLFITFTTKQVLCQTTFKYVTAKAVFGKATFFKQTKAVKQTVTISPNMLVKSSFYCDNLGYVCKQEIKIQKAIKFPFVFRIGSVQQVDYLEGKRGASILNR
jgi:hypothetical protein